jgi:hypothetical protein
MNDILDARTVHGRLRDYGLWAHTQVSSLLFSGIFALAAVVLLDILRTPDHRVIRLTMWVAAMVTEVATLTRQMQRPILMVRSGMDDLPVLVARGFLTLIALALVAPQYGGVDGWRYGLFAAFGVVLCSRQLVVDFVSIASTQNYAPGIRQAAEGIVASHRSFLGVYRGALPVIPVMAVLLAFAPRDWTFVEPIVFGYVLLGVGTNVRLHIANQREWLEFERAVREAVRAETAEAQGTHA